MMLRLLVTICFSLATVLGPGLCCCAFSQQARQEPAKLAEPPAGHCPHCRTKAAKQQQPTKPAPANKDCPCKQKPDRCPILSLAATAPARQPLAPADAGASDGMLIAILPIQGMNFGIAPLPFLTGDLPFLETDDLLYAFHILRC